MKNLTPEQRDHLRRMEVNGKLTPSQVVEDAKQGGPLNDLFDWDVDRAAEAHWLDTAREIIRTVRVVVTTTRETIDVVRYVSDPNRGQGQGYMSIFNVTTDEDRRKIQLTEIERALGSVRRAHAISVALGESGAQHIIEELFAWRAEARGDQLPVPIITVAADSA